MGIPGTQIKASAASVRNTLGSACMLNDETNLGKVLVAYLNPGQVREALGDDWSDEQGLEWARFDIDPQFTLKSGDKITVTTSARSFIVNRVTRPIVDEIIISNLCLCVVKM